MKKLLSFVTCLLLLCGVVLLSSCIAPSGDYVSDDPTEVTSASPSGNEADDDLPPNWEPAAPLPDDAVILNDETGIPDVALYIAVLRAIDHDRMWHFAETGEGTFTAGEAAAITSLTIRPAGSSTDVDEPPPSRFWYPPRNLRGIEHLRSLEELRLFLSADFGRLGAGLESVNELRRLEHLPYLRVFDYREGHAVEQSQLDSLKPLQNLTRLTDLGISATRLISLNGIQNLTNLENLRVWASLTNLRGIEHLSNLRHLEVSGNRLTSLNELRGLVSLTHVAARENRLTDINAVAYLPNLEVLDVSRNRLEQLPDLTDSDLVAQIESSSSPFSHVRGTSFSENRLSREQLERNLPISLLQPQNGQMFYLDGVGAVNWLEMQLSTQNGGLGQSA